MKKGCNLLSQCHNDDRQLVTVIFFFPGNELFNILDDQDFSVFIFSSQFRSWNGDYLQVRALLFSRRILTSSAAFQFVCFDGSVIEAKYGNLAQTNNLGPSSWETTLSP